MVVRPLFLHKPVELPDHQRVAGAHVVERRAELRALTLGAGGLLGEDPPAAGALQCVDLQAGVLVLRRPSFGWLGAPRTACEETAFDPRQTGAGRSAMGGRGSRHTYPATCRQRNAYFAICGMVP